MLKRPTVGLMLTLALFAAGAMAQEGGATFTSDLLDDFARTSDKMVQLAEAMPEDLYPWRPDEGVRTVGEVYMHFVGVNFLLPGGLGATPPEGLEVPEGGPMAMLAALEADVTMKSDVLAKLNQSIEYVKASIPQIEDLETEVNMFGFPGTKRAIATIKTNDGREFVDTVDNAKGSPQNPLSDDELIAKFRTVDFTQMHEGEDATNLQGEIACAGGSCELV